VVESFGGLERLVERASDDFRLDILQRNISPMDKQWSPSEKKAAHQIFDLAVINAQKDILKRHSDKKISTAADLWDYEFEIREWRKEVQNTLQFKYSSLPLCFALCLR